MFDIGFSELLLIGVVALVVIGPEKLPRVARTIGHLLGKAQRYVNDVKSEINHEIELDELRKLQSDIQQTARNIETDLHTGLSEAENQTHDISKEPVPNATLFEENRPHPEAK